MSRKRAPLIHRPSTDSDIKPVCRSLCLATDQDEINTLLLRLFDIGCSGLSHDTLPALLKLIVSKLPSSSSDSMTRGLISFISSLPAEFLTKPTTIRLVRWLVRLLPSERIAWLSPSPRLLFIEMCCWDTLKTSHFDKIDEISNHLVNISIINDEDILAALLLTGREIGLEIRSPALDLLSIMMSIHRDPTISSLSEYIDEIAQFSTILDDHSQSVRIFSCIKLLLYSETRWIAKIVDLLSNKSSNDQFLKVCFPHQENTAMSPNINRNIMSEMTHDALSSHTLSPIQKLVLGSNMLQYSKWSSIDISKLRIFGLLSPLISEDPEKLVTSILSDQARHSSMKSLYMISHAVIVVADAFRAIRYIPGEMWVLERALEIFKSVPIVGKTVCEFCKNRIRNVYCGSPTSVKDMRIELLVESLLEPGSSILLNNQAAPLSHVGLLREFIESQFLYKRKENGEEEPDHRIRLTRFLDQRLCTPFEDIFPVGSLCIEFKIFKTCLNLRVFNPALIFDEIVCENFSWSTTVSPLVSQLEALMADNKESVKCATDHGEFWEARKSIDEQLGKLITEIEMKLIGSSGRKLLRQFIDSNDCVIELILPDILLALPIESLPSNVSSKRLRYVVNPGADCGKSEEVTLPLLERNGWSGSSGLAAGSLTDDEFINLLKASDIFLYSGHGGGEKHWSGSAIQRMRYSNGHGVALLMGCSSTKPYGDYAAPFCTPFHYLIGGYRLVAGTLWDVLGRELDRMTESIIDSITGSDRFSINKAARVIANSRGRAKLKFLSSASIVMYGVGKFN